MEQNQNRPLNTEDWIVIIEECFKEPDFNPENITLTATFESPTYGRKINIGSKIAQLKQMAKDPSSLTKSDQSLLSFLKARCPQLFKSSSSGNNDQTM